VPRPAGADGNHQTRGPAQESPRAILQRRRRRVVVPPTAARAQRDRGRPHRR